jgi:hypothetical protein
MAIEPRLKELTSPSRLAIGFFNSVIRRIECTKPLGSTSITATQTSDGYILEVNNAVTLNVCSNGIPEKIVVYYDVKRTGEANS